MTGSRAADVARHVAALVPGWRAVDVTDVTYLEGGYSNRNYAFRHRGQRWVIRLPEREQPYVDRAAESRWYHALPAGFVKPLVLDVATGRMITPWVDGELLARRGRVQPGELAEYLSALHGALPPNERHYDVAALVRRYGYGEADGADPVASRACHNDLNPWNVLVTGNGWVTLDWEFAGNNDPLFDLVALHEGLSLGEGGPADAGLAALARLYLGHDAPERLAGVWRRFWLREAAWAHYQIARGNARDGVREQLERAQDLLASR